MKKLPSAERRSLVMFVRVNRQEHAAMIEAASRDGSPSASEWLRDLAKKRIRALDKR